MKTAFVFPGQGLQAATMLHTLPREAAVLRTLDEVSEALGFDVLRLDTAEALASTVAVQLALLTSGIAMARALEAAGVAAEAVAGLSVGAFAAATHAGVLSLQDAVTLVRLRAESMQAHFRSGFGMSVIVGLPEHQVSELVAQVNRPETPVFLGNCNAPAQMAIAGAEPAMDAVLALARAAGASRADRLPVAVPSHCPLLEPVAGLLRERMQSVVLHPPRMAYLGNRYGRPLRTAAAIAEDLAGNVAHAVRWHECLTVLGELGCELLLEMPPGHVSTDLARAALPGIACRAMERIPLAYAARLARQDTQR